MWLQTRSEKTLLLFILVFFAATLASAQCSFNISTNVSNVSCFNGTNGSVAINVTGSTGPYQYQLAEAGAGAWQSNTNIYNGLGAGVYPVSVKDNNGCIQTTYITITQPTKLDITYEATDATCTGSGNGSITTTTTGGVAPYTYSWTLNGSAYSTQPNISNLSPGNYKVVVTDANGCTATPVIPSQAAAISVTGFNADGIASGTSASSSTSTSMDTHPGSVLFESGFSNPSGVTRTDGIPSSGNFISEQDATRSFQLASFSGNNELLLRSSSDNGAGGATSGTLTFATQYRSSYSVLYVLGTTGSGTGSTDYIVNFSDGTTETGTITFPDWYYSGSTNVALGGLSRVTRSSSNFDSDRFGKFNLFELPITISVPDQNKIINSVSFIWSGAGAARINIFGISGYNATGNGIRINEGSPGTITTSVSITSDAVSNTFCAGQPVTFTAVPVNGGTSPSYQWKLNGVDVGTNSPAYTNSSLTDNDKVTVVMTSNLTCAITNAATSNQITMSSGTVPASVSINASATSICSGSPVNFTALPVNGGSAPSYQWKLNGANTGINSSSYSSSGLANGDQVSVVMTSGIGCVTPNPSTSNIVTMAVTQTASPSITIVSSPVNPQPGNNVTFTAHALYGGSSPSLQWFKNGTAINGATAPTLSINNAVHTDYYSVKLTSNYSCATVPAAMSNFIYIGNVVLPAKLDWFRASKTNNNVSLKWKTSYESGVSSFDILRSSSSGGNFVKTGSVAPNNIPTGGEYLFNDIPPGKGTYTYRLVQVDRDGKQIILGTKIINWDGQVRQTVADLGNTWQITSSEACLYELIDMQGRIISKGNIVSRLSIAKPVARGIYIMRLYTGDLVNIIKLK